MVIEKKTSPVSIHKQKDGSGTSLKETPYIIQQKTYEEIEIDIQADRVLYVLDEAIQKIKIAAHLGHLTQNDGKLLSKYLRPKDVEFILVTCNLFLELVPIDEDVQSTQSLSDTVSAKFTGKGFVVNDQCDISLVQCVDIIYGCPQLLEFIDSLDIEMDSLSTTLIQGMTELIAVAKEKLAVSAAQEKEYEKTLRDAWKDNIEATYLIEGLQERLAKQNSELHVQVDEKENLINMYTENIETTQAKFKEDIKKRVAKSEKTMMKQSQISEEKQQELSQQAKEATQSYNQLLEQHLASEKILRGKRFKVEAQLGSWLEKYDKDIGDRQAELEDLQAQYDAEKAEMDALQAKFDEQDEEYLELMAEKKDYEDDIFNKKYYAFLMNRAARMIQRCWRAYRERKKARKKAKHKKKKGKASAEEPKPPPPPEPVETEDIEKEMFGDTTSQSELDEEPPPGEEEEVPADKEKKGKGKGKGKKKPKKKDKKEVSFSRADDPNAALDKGKLASHVFEEISENPISSGPEQVDLNT